MDTENEERHHSHHDHHGHHRHHKHHKFHKIRRWFKENRKTIVAVAIIAVVIVSGLSVWAYSTIQKQNSRHVTAGNSINMGSGYRNITYKGKNYQYNSLITTVLYAGIDSDGIMEQTGFTDAPQADSIYLAIIDKQHEKLTIMGLNRDTMTDIRRYSATGRDRGTYTSHLCLAFTYGDGGKTSCENLREAVSNLIGGLPITEYVVTNRSSLPYINDLAGGITVTVPNDDLEEVDPVFQKGAQVKLDETNIETYLRTRDIGVDFSNEGRLERQQEFITAFVNQMLDKLRQEPEATWNNAQRMVDYVQTSITKNKYIDLVNLVDTVSFEGSNFYFPEGEDRLGDLHDEFYIDEAALQDKIIELFYEEY